MNLDIPEIKKRFEAVVSRPRFGSMAGWIGLLVLLFAVYFFLGSKHHQLKTELELRTQTIVQAKANGLGGLSPSEITGLQKWAVRFEASFMPLSEAASVLDEISEKAAKYRVQVININSESPVFLKETQFFRLPVSMRLEAAYQPLSSFLKFLEGNRGIFVVESYQIRKASPKSVTLECDLVLSFFSRAS